MLEMANLTVVNIYMRTITLEDHIKQVQARKNLLGITNNMIEACRNNGERRTLEKRELLRQIEERARVAGLTPLPANF